MCEFPGFEPLPYCPFGDSEDNYLSDVKTQFKPNLQLNGGIHGSTAMPLMTMPLCMQFARNMGGRSFIGRRVTMNMFGKATGGVGMDRVNLPLHSVDRRHHLPHAHASAAQRKRSSHMWDQTAIM